MEYTIDNDTKTNLINDDNNIIIKTPKSFLKKFNIAGLISKIIDIKLLDDCVGEVSEKLHIKPPITIRGIQYNQNRDIGFFSEYFKCYKIGPKTQTGLCLFCVAKRFASKSRLTGVRANLRQIVLE